MARSHALHPVPSELLTHIGDITVSFALLELQLQILLDALDKERSRSTRVLVLYLSFGDLCAAILSVYRERFGEDHDFEALQSLIVEATKLSDERNRITHSYWASGDTPASITRLKSTARLRKGVEHVQEQYDAARLSGVAVRIQDACEDLVRFTFKRCENGKFAPVLGIGDK
jgi:hypothetical protein